MQICIAEGHTFIGSALSERSVVLDLGANRGNFTRQMRRQFRNRIISVEANPQVARALRESGANEVIEKAISDRVDNLPLRVCANDESSTLLLGSQADEVATIMVPTISLPRLAAELTLDIIDLVKVDIEGAEIAMFDSCSDEFIKRVCQFTVEFHDFNGLVSRSEVHRVLGRLQRLGFLCVNMWRTSHGDVLCVNSSLVHLTRGQCFRLKYLTRSSQILRHIWSRVLSSPAA